MTDHDWADWTPEDAYREGREESAEEIDRLQAELRNLRERVEGLPRYCISQGILISDNPTKFVKDTELRAALKGASK